MPRTSWTGTPTVALAGLAGERGTSLRDAIDHLAEEAQRLPPTRRRQRRSLTRGLAGRCVALLRGRFAAWPRAPRRQTGHCRQLA
jgi:hypothetical protein